MEFLVIVLFVVAIVAVNFVISRAQRRKKQADSESGAGGESRQSSGAKPQRATGNGASAAKAGGRTTSKRPAKAAPGTPRTSVEAAREANARLDATAHQQVYAAIAQGHPIKAVQLYAKFTGVGVRAAGAAVENLAMHPQPFVPQQPQRPASDAPAGAADNAPVSPKTGDAAGSSVSGRTAKDQNAAPEDTNPLGTAPEGPAASTDKSRQGPAAKPATTPEEDEISKWVKNLRPEDF
ncbi:hypothetical protein [Arthrobacter sp. 08Y14]|uniref:hypothetical protein n=1 Tax=Arthrobacter sp. 08Y14 TaxID=2058885 RepID=UPI000CE56EFA|nr:hypothetical protein [Arthrobacter sp. 08Y14]